jgi:hypothetical protein
MTVLRAITARSVNVVHGLTGAVGGPVGPTGSAGLIEAMGATGPTGPIGSFHTGPTGPLVVGPTGVIGATGPSNVGLDAGYVEGSTGPKGPGLPLAMWTGANSNPTGPHDSQFYNFQGLKIKVLPVLTGNIYFCFTGTFLNQFTNGGMNIHVRRGLWQYVPDYHGSLAGAQVSIERIYRNLQPNMRTEFVIEFIDGMGTDAVENEYFYDLNVIVYPTGSLVQLYDLEWVLMEI